MAMAKDEPWLSSSASPPDVHIRVHGVLFHVNKRCMASRSAKLAHLLESNNYIDLTINSFTDVPADAQTFSLVARFSYGRKPDISADNVIPLACVASCLEMTEEHSANNLLNMTLAFITTRILPHWSQTVRAFRAVTQPMLPHAEHLGIVHACLKTISAKAAADPNLISMITVKAVTARRKLFAADDDHHPLALVEDLTSLSLPLYQLAVSALKACSDIPDEHLAQCVYRYAKRWGGDQETTILAAPAIVVSRRREVIEAAEKLMPSKRGAIHVKCLFQLLRSAIFLQASKKCCSGFEERIGKQLPEASAEDLCIPCYGYAKETEYDTRCVIRILSHFSSSSTAEVEAVSIVLEDFLAEVAADRNLRKEEFVATLEVLVAVLEPFGDTRSHDGVYRAIDVYLDAHRFLTEKERLEICRGLDLRRLSVEASEHAANSERLPLRTIAQVLFVGQLRIRQEIGKLRGEEMEMEVEEEVVEVEEEMEEMEINSSNKEISEMYGRVGELEKECARMRKEIDRKKNNDGWKWWKGVKRNVLGCKNSSKKKSSAVECNCQLIKKPRPQVYPNRSTN